VLIVTKIRSLLRAVAAIAFIVMSVQTVVRGPVHIVIISTALHQLKHGKNARNANLLRYVTIVVVIISLDAKPVTSYHYVWIVLVKRTLVARVNANTKKNGIKNIN
jgi:hypothetical protein